MKREMEWLQTYKIGKALIDSGQYKPIDAYYEKPKFEPEKRNWIIDLIIDLPNEEIRLNPVTVHEKELKRTINEDNLFVRGGSNFNSFYLCTPLSSITSILDFFDITHKKDKKTEKEKPLGESFEQKFDLKLIKNDQSEKEELNLLFLRKKIIENKNLLNRLQRTILNINYLLGSGKNEKDYKKYIKNYPQSCIEIEKLKSNLPLDKEEEKELEKLKKDTKNFNGLLQSEVRLNLAKTSNDQILYVRTLLIDEKELILSQLPDYETIYLNRFIEELGKLKNPKKGTCYFSREEEVYNVGFPRDGLANLLKVCTGTETYSPFFKGDNFLMGKETYNAIKLGARFISDNLTINISRIQHYIIPEFREDFDFKKLDVQLTKNIELAFNPKKYDDTRKSIYCATEGKLNSIAFIGFVISKGSFQLTNVIRVPNAQYFDKIFEIFDECVNEMDNISKYSFNFPFNSTYYVFAERYKKDGNKKVSLNKPQSLEFFKMLFERSSIEKAFLMNAYKHLINVYHFGKPAKEGDAEYGGTLNISCWNPFDKNKFDSKISFATKKYIVLLNLTRRLGLLRDKTTIKMENSDYSKLNETTRTLFENSAYSAQHKALFFLGKMICRVANAQHKKGAKHKPILNKINYSGMGFKDLIWLSCEVFEKMKQYNKSLNTFNFGQEDMTAFKYYFDQFNGKSWQLSEVENVFYIFSGYALYWETIDTKEKDTNEKIGISEETVKEPDEEVTSQESTEETDNES